VRVLPRSTTGPYVSVAVDNHFHDIHPEDDVEIAADRTFVVENQGRNLHNVTILGTGVNEDIRPGQMFRTRALQTFLEVGEDYSVVCRFHAEVGMTGKFTVVGE
jgi:plastocyanin